MAIFDQTSTPSDGPPRQPTTATTLWTTYMKFWWTVTKLMAKNLFGCKNGQFLTKKGSKTGQKFWCHIFKSIFFINKTQYDWFPGKSQNSKKNLVLAVLALFGSKIHCMLWQNGVFGGFWQISSNLLMLYGQVLLYDHYLLLMSEWT